MLTWIEGEVDQLDKLTRKRKKDSAELGTQTLTISTSTASTPRFSFLNSLRYVLEVAAKGKHLSKSNKTNNPYTRNYSKAAPYEIMTNPDKKTIKYES